MIGSKRIVESREAKWIQWITEELQARVTPATLRTATRKYRLTLIKRRYQLSGSTHSIVERLETLKSVLELLKRQERFRREALERDRVRRMPLGRVLRGEPKPCEISNVNTFMNYWDSIIGHRKPYYETPA